MTDGVIATDHGNVLLVNERARNPWVSTNNLPSGFISSVKDQYT